MMKSDELIKVGEYNVYLSDTWMTGECRRGEPERCGQLAALREGWMACSNPVHDVDNRVDILQEILERSPRKGHIVKLPTYCECGCGDTTKGGKFKPGHDTKLKSRLVAALEEGDEDARAKLVELGWA